MNCVKCADSFILNFFDHDQSNFNKFVFKFYRNITLPSPVHTKTSSLLSEETAY